MSTAKATAGRMPGVALGPRTSWLHAMKSLFHLSGSAPASRGAAVLERSNDEPFPLAQAKVHETVRVVGVRGETNDARRLAHLGLVANARVEVACSSGWGVVVVLGGTSRLALDRQMADEVFVARA